MKKHIFRKTSVIVIAYGIVFAVSMILQAVLNFLPTVLQKFQENELPSIVYVLNNELKMPLAELSFLWISIVAAYVGIDRAAYAAKTFTLSYGEQDVGDSHIIRMVILATGLIYLEGVILNAVVAGDYYLGNLATAFGSSVLLYVGGQKAGKIGKYRDGGNHLVDIVAQTYAQDPADLDGDGIVTEEEKEAYDKEQKRFEQVKETLKSKEAKVASDTLKEDVSIISEEIATM